MNFFRNLIVALVTLTLAAFADSNFLDANLVGRFVGQTADGEPCSLVIHEITRSFFTRRPKTMSVEIEKGNSTYDGIEMTCKNHIEEGFSCSFRAGMGLVVLRPYHRNETYTDEAGNRIEKIVRPYYFYDASIGDGFRCKNLSLDY